MPSKAIELASFDLYKRVLSPSTHQTAPGGLVTSIAGGLAGLYLAFFFPPHNIMSGSSHERKHLSSKAMHANLLATPVVAPIGFLAVNGHCTFSVSAAEVSMYAGPWQHG